MTPTTDLPPLYSIPKPLRPPHGSLLTAISFCVLFNLGIILTNLFQILTYPLSLTPLTFGIYLRLSAFTKGSFGALTIGLSQWFAPTKFVVTAGEGMPGDGSWIRRGSKGEIQGILLPDRGIWIANHQTLADWLYLWSFTSLSGHHRSILITLKSSLKWIPFVGWACQLYGFVFLARNWATDKGPFASQLERVSRELKQEGAEGKLALLVFPEGTLVTGNTRPKSKLYADKLGVEDLKLTLLPRSTGLFFALRTLSRTLPSLHLIDLTVAYPGVHLPSYPEDHYDLSIWLKSVPPPSIHVHIRTYHVAAHVPLGSLEGEGTEEEKLTFDKWLRDLWSEKDRMMLHFLKKGSFDGIELEGQKEEGGGGKIEWPIEMRHWYEHFEAFSYFIPIIALYFIIPFVLGIVKLGIGFAFGRAVVGEVVAKTACGCSKMAAEKVVKGLGEL